MASFVRITALLWADILAVFSMSTMMTYLTNVWKFNLTHAAAIINIWEGVKFVMPIGFALLVDTFMSDFAMLLMSSISYSIGLGFLAISTPPVLSKSLGNCSAYKPECIGHAQKILYYTALAFIAVGISGHAVSLFSFRTKQVNVQTEDENKDKDFGRKLAWHCAGNFAVPIIGGIALPYIKPWSILFGIQAICTAVATLLFLSGSYKHDKRRGSHLTNLFRDFVASASKIWHQCLRSAPTALPTGPTRKEQEKNIETVKDIKIGIRMIPMCMTFIFFGVVISIGKTYFIEQANHMNRKLGHWTVPLPIFLTFNILINYEFGKVRLSRLYCKIERRIFSGSGSQRYGPPTGIAVAMVVSVLCCITAAKVETQRHSVIKSHSLLDKPDENIPMSVFSLLPQFLLLGMVDGISRTCIDEFFQNQAPAPMKRYLTLFTHVLFGLGNMASVLLVYMVGKVSEKGEKPNWFQDTLNRSRLDNYYWTLTVLSCVILVLYILVALCYPYRESASKDVEAPQNQESAQPNEDDIQFCCCCDYLFFKWVPRVI
ncbi:protein NRT1/ PTR FAMILY 5.5-like isoform X2 [Cornus florida]|uniref:protein NRT1/ PTR FAMILY 5.5-like isoform X2 n=1 Tax=Cornus florida TaxID=4283 RepID=UPI0028A2202D|nr:protein NRT1/ PTR FAMILY 5.5-like isoform X2 [Cornus florida]XP_059647162.1 protein NRT1/ PTR FAMILY 5.5-like isoform X2 [Cornus florida]